MFFSIKTQIIMWLIAALVVAPLIDTLGLNRPRGADKGLSPDELEQVWRTRLRKSFEFLALIGGTLGILYLLQRGMRDADGLLYGIMQFFLWTFGLIVVTVVIALVAHFLSGPVRNAFHIGLCVLFVFGFVLPLTFDLAQDRAVTRERTSVATEYIDFQKGLRLQWRADIDAAVAHGGEGVVPPMLQVLDSGDGVQVTNLSDETICVDVRRSLAKFSPGYDYQCALWSDRGMLHSCVDYKPGHTEWLHMSPRPDMPSCSGEPLEFRVGGWREDSIGWWSDAALEEFDRHTTDHSRRETTQFDSADMRSNDFMREVMRELRTREVGPSRVAHWLEQLNAADQKRATLTIEAPAEPAGTAQQLNALRAAQAKLQEIKYLRERVSRDRERDRLLEFPDYLPVQDNLDSATVNHPLGAVFYVRLTRAGRDSSTGQEFLCEMRGLGGGTEFGTYVSKTRPGQFALASREGLCADPANSTLQMVVHDFNGRLTFASPGALIRLEAEAEAHVLALQPGLPLPE